MKSIIKYCIILLCFSSLNAQLNLDNDIYIFRNDTGFSCHLQVKINDTSAFPNLKIISVSKKGINSTLYSSAISSDSNFIHLSSINPGTYADTLVYYCKDSAGTIDSAFVFFSRTSLTPDVFFGDANNDSLVNHLDLFPIGLMYGKYGSPKDSIDIISTSFLPKRAGNWVFQNGGINGKFADINGDGLINEFDWSSLNKYFGQSYGIYKPKLSDSSTTTQLIVELNLPNTLVFNSGDSSIKFNVQFANKALINGYGLGYSVSVSHLNKVTQQDSVYNKFNLTPNTQLWASGNQINIVDPISNITKKNLGYSKTNGLNGGLGSDVGVVEIIVDVILLGLTNKFDSARIRVDIIEVALIDNNYTTIPVKGSSRYIYLKKNTAGINSNSLDDIQVYPNLVSNYTSVYNPNLKDIRFQVFNSVGQTILSQSTKQHKTNIETNHWAPGIYYLKLENSSKVFKLKKL